MIVFLSEKEVKLVIFVIGILFVFSCELNFWVKCVILLLFEILIWVVEKFGWFFVVLVELVGVVVILIGVLGVGVGFGVVIFMKGILLLSVLIDSLVFSVSFGVCIGLGVVGDGMIGCLLGVEFDVRLIGSRLSCCDMVVVVSDDLGWRLVICLRLIYVCLSLLLRFKVCCMVV